MKRYPKRARPLWGCAKPKKPVEYIYGPLTLVIEGEDHTGAHVRESFEWPDEAATFTSKTKFRSAPRITSYQSKMRADLKINFTVADPDAPPDPSIYRVTVGAPVADLTIPADAVAVLPPVEVRP